MSRHCRLWPVQTINFLAIVGFPQPPLNISPTPSQYFPNPLSIFPQPPQYFPNPPLNISPTPLSIFPQPPLNISPTKPPLNISPPPPQYSAVNWCGEWFEYFPNPPLNILALVENLLAHHDPHLLQHFIKLDITSQVTDVYNSGPGYAFNSIPNVALYKISIKNYTYYF